MLKIPVTFFLLLLCPSLMADSKSNEGASVYFISPADGATVKNQVTIKFGLKNMGIAPAGIQYENTGHHHLIVDADLPSLEHPVPGDDHHLHFGKGQTETELVLSPGEHTLQLLFGDYSHTPHTPPVYSERITINVE